MVEMIDNEINYEDPLISAPDYYRTSEIVVHIPERAKVYNIIKPSAGSIRGKVSDLQRLYKMFQQESPYSLKKRQWERFYLPLSKDSVILILLLNYSLLLNHSRYDAGKETDMWLQIIYAFDWRF